MLWSTVGYAFVSGFWCCSSVMVLQVCLWCCFDWLGLGVANGGIGL